MRAVRYSSCAPIWSRLRFAALLQTAARAVLRGGSGSLVEQVNRARNFKPPTAPPPWRVTTSASTRTAAPTRPALEFFNGLGGFGADGREYVTILEGADCTPAPWINVIANPAFGFQVSADGGGFTWALNSQQNQITPWSNDPVGDRARRSALYARRGDRRSVDANRPSDPR